MWLQTDIICMTTVEVSRLVHKKIKEFSDGESVDATLNRLMDLSEHPVKYTDEDLEKTNIWMNKATLERLKEYKLYDRESHSNTILRLLQDLM